MPNVCFWKAVHIHSTPVTRDFLDKCNILQDLKKDRQFFYNMWLAHFTGARESMVQMIIDSYVSYMKDLNAKYRKQTTLDGRHAQTAVGDMHSPATTSHGAKISSDTETGRWCSIKDNSTTTQVELTFPLGKRQQGQ